MEFQSIKNSIHYVFDTKDEYEQHFLSQGIPVPKIVANWREAKELDWCMSDDDRIIQILRRGPMKNTVRSPDKKYHANYYIRTVAGSFPVSKNQKMDTDLSHPESRYIFGQYTNWKKRFEAREENTKYEDMFVYMVAIVRDKPVNAYMKIYGTNNYRYALRRAYILMKQERIKLAIRKELKTIATSLKMDDKFHLEKVKGLIENADKDGIKLAALRLSGEWTGMNEKEDLDNPTIPINPDAKKLDTPEKQKRLAASNKSIAELKNINE